MNHQKMTKRLSDWADSLAMAGIWDEAELLADASREIRSLDKQCQELTERIRELERLKTPQPALADRPPREKAEDQRQIQEGEDALQYVMRVCHITNNARNRYIVDAVAEKLVRQLSAKYGGGRPGTTGYQQTER